MRIGDAFLGALSVGLVLGCAASPPPLAPASQPAEDSNGLTANAGDTPADASPAAIDPDAPPCKGAVVKRDVRAHGLIEFPGEAQPPSAVDEININGDDQLELFVRGPCERGKTCDYAVYAACGNGTYALIPAQGLKGDRIETSRKGALYDGVYWRDIIVLQFQTKGDKLGEGQTRFRFNGHSYEALAQN